MYRGPSSFRIYYEILDILKKVSTHSTNIIRGLRELKLEILPNVKIIFEQFG